MNYQNSITFDRLKYFVEAAKQEHIGRAAKVLAVSPSVVSSAIKNLEEELGCQLFARERQTIRLNNEGRRLLESSLKILESVQNLSKELTSKPLFLKGHFRLAASHFLMNQYLVPAVLKLQEEESHSTFEFCSLDSGVAIAQLQAGLIDGALVFRSSYVESLNEEILWSGNFKIVVKKDHPVLSLTLKKRVEALNSLPAITFRTSAGANFWERHPALISAGLAPQHSYFYDDTATALNLLEHTQGWAFLPEFLVKNNSKLKVVTLAQPLKAAVNISLVTNTTQKGYQLLERLKPLLLA